MIMKVFYIPTELSQKLMEVQVPISVDWQNIPQIVKLNDNINIIAVKQKLWRSLLV